MAQPYFSSRGSSAAAFPDQMPQYSQPDSYPAFPLLLGSGHVPNNLLYWSNNNNNNNNNHQVLQPDISPVARSSFSLLQQQQQQQQHHHHQQPPPPAQHQQHQQQQQPSTEQRKHKRTRSGCLTCRARRIKCDEGRPVCERCRKGNRPCEYAQPNARSTNRTKSRRQSSLESISSDDDNAEPGSGAGLDVIPDEDETAEIPGGRRPPTIPEDASSKKTNMRSPSKHRPRKTSEASSGNKSNSLSPASDLVSLSPSSSANSQYKNHVVQRPARDLREMFKHKRLKDDVWYFLKYHQEKLNHNHYLMNYETDAFFRGTLLDLAVDYEPLLYALVGFAAYHHTLENPRGKLYDFLKYYDRSLQLLRKSLASGSKHNEGTLATILQLSTFEESIGDFMNLVDHHQAADELIHELLTPTSITQNHVHRYLFIWHARFDLVACIIASNEAILGPEWYTAIERHDTAQAVQNPDDFFKQLQALASRTRLFAMEFASLFAQLSRGLISSEEFEVRFKSLNQVINDLHRVLEQYDQCDEVILPRPAVPLQGPEDVLDTTMPCRFYRDSKWMLNFMWPDVLATELMFKYQSHILMGQPEGAELQRIALQICHHAESIARWPEVEVGSIVGFHNWMILTTLFLPKDSKHMMWTRRLFAQVEVNGYVYAPRVRRALSEVWNDASVEEWWDPNDQGGCPSLIKEIRSLTEERTTSPRDQVREDVRDLKSLFGSMRIDDSTPE